MEGVRERPGESFWTGAEEGRRVEVGRAEDALYRSLRRDRAEETRKRGRESGKRRRADGPAGGGG